MEPGNLLGLTSDRDVYFLRRACIGPGILYPWWHELAPSGAVDPRLVWWLVGGVLLASGLATYSRRVPARVAEIGYYTALLLITLQLFGLSLLNPGEAFYATGFAMAVGVISPVLRTRFALRAYLFLVLGLGAVGITTIGDPFTTAIWTASLLVVLVVYLRLRKQDATVRAAQAYEAELERRVEARTRTLSERTRELAEYAGRLRREIEERKLLEEQLRFSQKIEAVGRLAGGVAHDFNNLLTAIEGYTDLLLKSHLEGQAHEDLEQIQRACRQATALVQQLLSFSRRQVVPTTVLNLNAVVSECSAMLRALLAEDTELVERLGEDLDRIRCNRNQLQQVILNLALNARDAMPDGGRFTIETFVQEVGAESDAADAVEPGRYVVLVVSDTGDGMDPEVRSRAFDPFFSTKRVQQGTGLGLSIVYGIVKQSGGHIRLVSEKGRGTRVEIYWPSVRGDTAERMASGGSLVDPESGATLGGSERILLVEDRGELRQLVSRVLRSNGYTVLEACDGEEALALGDSDAFDLVVSDVVMPQMSGFELADRLLKSHPDTRILFISGHLNHPAVVSKDLPPDVRLLAKPFAPRELVAAVRESLDRPLAGDAPV